MFLLVDLFDSSVLDVLMSIPITLIPVIMVIYFINRLAFPDSSLSFNDNVNPFYTNNNDITAADETTGRGTIETYDKCNSPGCLRCKTYTHVTENLTEKFDDFLKRTCANGEAIDLYQRVKLSLEKLEIKTQDNEELGNFGGMQSMLQKPTVFQLHELSAKPWYEKADVCRKDVELLEASFSIIWEEFVQIYEDFVQGNSTGWLSNFVPSGQWSVFHLYNQGKKVTSNCERCPETTSILDKLDTLMHSIAFGNATFTVLQAGTHITEHYGPCNLRIRCHLGWYCPACTIKCM